MTDRNILTYTVDELSRQLDPHAIKDFIITDINRRMPPFLLEYPHRLDGIVFTICTKGWARFRVNMRELIIKPGTIVTILPGFIIEPIENSEDLSLETLFFSFDFISGLPLATDMDLLVRIEECPCLPISDEQARNLLKFHTFIMEQYNRKEHLYRQEIARYLLFALIAEIGSLYTLMEKNCAKLTRSEKLLSSFLILLRRHYKKEHGIAFYAGKLCLTPKYLTTTIKAITGKSAMAWIHEIVIVAAKAELKSTSKTILQISEELNFSDASLFCRFFRKHTGLTPKQYRESGVNVIIS